jgi:hypothetical protein
MMEQRAFVGQQLVEATIQRILLHQRVVCAQQIGHRALLKPQSVQAPFATGIEQAVNHQCLQDVSPTGAFSTIRQAYLPEVIKPELLVQPAGKPAGAPWPRPMQLHGVQPHLDAIGLGVFG